MANIITELHLEMSANWYVSKKLNSIGRVGENTVTKLTIEPTEILDNVTYELETMSADGSKNVAELTIDGTELYLILTANMLTTSGITKMQVRAVFEDGSIKKSNIFELKVNRSISATEHYEEYAVTIFDQLVQDCRDIIEGAESYAIRAETAAVNAEAYSESASASATSASNSATTASTSATTAVNAATSAETSATTAHTSAETATTAAASASASATTATSASESAVNASTSASASATTAVNASNTATSAATSAENSATSATTAANNASASATAAANSATAASTSATSASASATSAVTSETNAAASAALASTSAANANTSATNAANSATSAATSATNAHNSEVNASTSETNASTSAAEAAETAESIAASVAQINENTYRINDLEAIIAGYQLTDLPTGEIATITDGTALLMPSLKVGIEPVQDLHGYDHPWAGGAGKNLYGGSALKSSLLTITGASEGSDNNGNFVNIPRSVALNDIILFDEFEENQQYTVIFKILPSGSAPSNIRIYYSDNTYHTISASADETLTTVTYTTEAGKTVSSIKLGYWYLSTCKIYYENCGVFVGANQTFEPYSNICPISGWTAANVTRTGKNIWDEEWEVGGISVSTGQNESATDIIRCKNHIPVKPNTAYHIVDSSKVYCLFLYDKNKNYITSVNVRDIQGANYTTRNDCYYIRFRCFAAYGTTYNNDISINYPSTNTEYHAHSGQTYTIQFTDGDNPLTVYGGTLDVTSGELVMDRAFLTNDYLVNTADYEPAGRNCYVLIGITLKTLGASVIDNKLIASALKTGSQDDLYSNRKIGIAHWWNTRIAFSTGDSNVTSKSEFKEWLSNNGSNVCYELTEPITYHLTPTQVRTLVGTNNIWADTGDIIEGKYYRSLT